MSVELLEGKGRFVHEERPEPISARAEGFFGGKACAQMEGTRTRRAPEAASFERPLIWPMRALLYVGGGFVIAAGLQLWLFADRTDEIFAWTIDAEVTAAFIGSFYWSAAVLALLSARQQTWARARPGVPGVLAFIWLTLLTTLLHLDVFHLDASDWKAQAAAWVWLAIYVAPVVDAHPAAGGRTRTVRRRGRLASVLAVGLYGWRTSTG